MIYSVRTLKPDVGEFVNIEAISPEDAAQELLFSSSQSTVKYVDRKGKEVQVIRFALVEVKGFGEMFARVYEKGIFRLGAQGKNDKFRVMRELGWTGTFDELVGPWEGESDWDS